MTYERASLAIDHDVIDLEVVCLIEFDPVALPDGREHTPRTHQQGGVMEERKHVLSAEMIGVQPCLAVRENGGATNHRGTRRPGDDQDILVSCHASPAVLTPSERMRVTLIRIG